VSHDYHDLFIAGRLTPAHSEAVLTTINPATEEPVGSAPDAGIGRESGPEGFEEYLTTKSIARQA
jgi:acyl-CoA reductase-like NAD-dependent aldehyde dehydrogenase